MNRNSPKTPPNSPDSKGSYAFVSLGCPKNLVDSERMLGLLKIDGYELVNDPDGADFGVVNTCGFIERARTERISLSLILADLLSGRGCGSPCGSTWRARSVR